MGEQTSGSGPSVTGFDFDAIDVDDYERYRPEYSAEAVAWLVEVAGLARRSTVLDLAAGTGKLSRALAAGGLEVVAVEPSAAMRRKLGAVVPQASIVDGTAEAIPLADGSVGCVAVGQAFHHFDPGPALEEIHRVLEEHGHLALFWTVYEHGDTLHSGLDEIIDRHVDPASAVCAAFGSWPKAFEATPLFASAGQRSFPHPHHLRSEHLASVMATSSDVASLPESQRNACLAEIRAWARTLPPELEMPADTRVDLYVRT